MDMSQIAKLLGQGGGMASSECLIDFKAGRMDYDGKKVTADKRRGTIKLIRDPQGIKQFQWIEAGSNNPYQNIMVFPGDARFVKVKQSKDRVYLLEFYQSKQRHFFWMQEKDEEEDATRCRKLHNLINGLDADAVTETSRTPAASAPKPATHSGPNTRAAPSTQPPNPGADSSQAYNDMLAQFFSQQNMGKMAEQFQQRSGPSLNSVITSQAKNSILEDEKACERLIEHCPEGQQNKDGLRENLHCPSLRHIFSSLQNAIENGQGHILLTQMGIDLNHPGEYQELVDLFNNIAKGGSDD